MRKRPLLLILLIAVLFAGFPPPQARAIDPVTIAILAPIALKMAETMRPYVQRGLISGIKGMIDMGGDMCEILYLPWGLIQSTLGIPFGGFGPGVGNIGKGLIAPFKVVLDAVLLPVKFLGVSVD